MPSGTSTPAPAASLIGRAAEVEDVLDLLGRARLVTLTGPPGVGKTRLALAVCAETRRRRRLGGPGAVARSRARSGPSWPGRWRPASYGDARTGCSSSTTVSTCSTWTPTWPASVVDLLRHSPRLQVLATSRERLRLAAEREYPVPPLPMPSADDADDLGPAARQPGRSRCCWTALRPPSSSRPNTARALAEICIGLDGLPLAHRAGRGAAAGLHAQRARLPARAADERADQRAARRPRAAPRPARRHRLEPRPALRARPRGLPAAVGLPGRVGPRERRCGVRRARPPRRASSHCWTRAWSGGPGRTATAARGSRC